MKLYFMSQYIYKDCTYCTNLMMLFYTPTIHVMSVSHLLPKTEVLPDHPLHTLTLIVYQLL